ncbi:TetR/AcrR family transcriptional regulator [Mycobacterium arosiense]|uniref:TetR/AcrR family transcriptional regulator n=1 Tax=Mycobacterium arosiense TaxID=425468 RepID=UPI001FECDAC1|nr:TetR/AcrR family transcriptional regulator [Mycobacterium arosiense]
MTFASTLSPPTDRRVRRSRAALMSSAIAVVTTHGTTNVGLSEIAERADVSRKVAYQQFGDLQTLLLEAGLDLARRELVPDVETLPPGRTRALACARHFAEHRVFYRALLTSSSGFALEAGLAQLLWPYTRDRLEELFGGEFDPQLIGDLAVHLGGGAMAMLKAWLTRGENHLDAEAFADRMLRVAYFLVPAGAASLTDNGVDGSPTPSNGGT